VIVADPPADFSVVIPFCNEEAVAFEVVDELGRALGGLAFRWEAILVDDGSTDGTATELERALARWPQCRIFKLERNCGQGAALLYGFQQASAPILAMMDGDGQNVPADFGPLRAMLDRADLIVGVRTPRNDSWLRRAMSRLANAVRSRVLGDGVSDPGCAIKVFRHEVLTSFLPVQMVNPFMPAFAVAGGFRVAERAVQHRARRGGRSKYGLRRLFWRPFLDLLAIAWMLHRRAPTGSIGRNRDLPS